MSFPSTFICSYLRIVCLSVCFVCVCVYIYIYIYIYVYVRVFVCCYFVLLVVGCLYTWVSVLLWCILLLHLEEKDNWGEIHHLLALAVLPEGSGLLSFLFVVYLLPPQSDSPLFLVLLHLLLLLLLMGHLGGQKHQLVLLLLLLMRLLLQQLGTRRRPQPPKLGAAPCPAGAPMRSLKQQESAQVDSSVEETRVSCLFIIPMERLLLQLLLAAKQREMALSAAPFFDDFARLFRLCLTVALYTSS